MTRILIVEDDLDLSQGVTLALREEGRSMVQVYTLQEALRVVKENRFDLVVLDLNLPDGNGLTLLQEMRQQTQTPVLILTANDMEINQVTGLELGADDYVTKPFSLAVLRARVNALLRRKRESVLSLAPFFFDFDEQMFVRDDQVVELSRTEQKVLRMLLENRGRTLTRGQLLDQVWDNEEFVDDNALSVTMKRLRDKLVDAPIHTIYGVGYRWDT